MDVVLGKLSGAGCAPRVTTGQLVLVTRRHATADSQGRCLAAHLTLLHLSAGWLVTCFEIDDFAANVACALLTSRNNTVIFRTITPLWMKLS